MTTLYNTVYPEIQKYYNEICTETQCNDYLIINAQINSILENFHLTSQILSNSCFLSGGLLSSLVSVSDMNIINNDSNLMKSDIDIYILGTKEEKQQRVTNIIKFLNRNSTKNKTQIKIIGATGSVIYIITDYEPRIYQLILMAESYTTPQSVIEEFDLDYVKMFYTGSELHIHKSAAQSIYTKETNYTVCTGIQSQCNATGVTQIFNPPSVGGKYSVSGTVNQIHKVPKLSKVLTRCMKAITRGYKINKESLNTIKFSDDALDIESDEFITKYITEDKSSNDNQAKYMFNDTINLSLEELLTIPMLKKKYETKYMSWQDISVDDNYITNGKLNMFSVKKYYKTEYGIKTLMNISSHHFLKKNKDDTVCTGLQAQCNATASTPNSRSRHSTSGAMGLEFSVGGTNIVSEIDKTLNINWFGLTRTAYYDSVNKPKNSIDAESIGKNILANPDTEHDLKIIPKLTDRDTSFDLHTSDYIDVCFRGYVIPCNYNNFEEGRLSLLLSHSSYAYLHALHKTYISYANNNMLQMNKKSTKHKPTDRKITDNYTKRLLVIEPVKNADLAYYTGKEDITTCDIGKQKQINHTKKFLSKVKYFSYCTIHVKLRFVLILCHNEYRLTVGSIINTKKPIIYDTVAPQENMQNNLVKYNYDELKNIQLFNYDNLFTNNNYNIYDLTGKLPTNDITDTHIKLFPGADSNTLENWITNNAFYKHYMDLQKHAYDIDESNKRFAPGNSTMGDIHNTNIQNVINNISQTVTYDTMDDILLLIEFKKPPVHIKNNFASRLYLYYYRKYMVHLKNEKNMSWVQARNEAKKLYRKQHTISIKGLLGELTDESYSKIQKLIKILNPQGYDTELYNDLYALYNLHDKFPGRTNLMFLNTDMWNRVACQSNFEHISISMTECSTKYAIKLCIRSVFCEFDSIYKHIYNIKLPFLYQQEGYIKDIEFTEHQLKLLNAYKVSYVSKEHVGNEYTLSAINKKYIDLINNPPSELNYAFVNDILPYLKKYIRWREEPSTLLNVYFQISVPDKSLKSHDYRKSFNSYTMPYMIINLNESIKNTGYYSDREKLAKTKQLPKSQAISYNKYMQENITNYHDYVTDMNYALLSEYIPYELIEIVNNYSINKKNCLIHIYETL